MARETGTVKWFSRDKGYGFIHTSSGDDVFAHHSEIAGDGFRTLRQGEEVEFEIMTSPKGPKARQIMRVNGAEGPDEVSDDAGRPSATATTRTDRNSLAGHIMAKLGGRFFNGRG